ncbi:PAS domain S-box protein [Altererythrobacter xixiisoli]|uniref:histidine kinase n=1 Tax=Croceibacterium xixiisoli TaxID=1476466 RepID=A0A6I4TW35_9SPHN|nr:PAS domain S-box protein [Croceibacterium xixiisoli]MXO98543.1 PAS domain S-box protein [Croceibacterium xixiisoli]
MFDGRPHDGQGEAARPGFLAGGGHCADLIAAKDWSQTPLGPLAQWPACLRCATALLLRSQVPIVMLWGEAGVMLYNDAYSGFSGGRHPDLLGSNVREGWPEVADFNDHVMQVGLAGGTLHYRDQELTLHRHGQPEQVWMDLDYSPVLDDQGQPAGVICFLADTTDRVQAERRATFLFDLAEDLRPLSTPAEIMALTAVRLGEKLDASRVFYAEIANGRMTVERDHVQGVDSIVGEHSLEAFGPDLLNAYRVGTPVVVYDVQGDERLSAEARAGLGSRDVGAFVDVVLFEDTQWVGLLAVQNATPRIWTPAEEALVQDVGERVRIAIERAREERDRLWNLSQDMLARADFTGMMSAVSPAWTQVLGWTEGELLTRGYATFMHPEDMAPTLAAIAGMSDSGEPARFENRIATRDGQWKHIEWTVAPEPDGKNFVAVGRDLSEARARAAELEVAQEALRQSQKMEAIGQLTGGVAHDFNNLLMAITSSLALLGKRLPADPAMHRLLDNAQQGADRGAALTQRMLAFARRQDLTAERVEISALLAGLKELAQRTIGPAWPLDFHYPADVPFILADPNQIEMALINLLVNARDASPDGGSIRVEADSQMIGLDECADLAPGRYVRIAVIDQGTGMDAETLARATEPFFTTKGVGKGTGLGLSMIHGLARQLEGNFTLESTAGTGTTATLWLPASAGETDAAVSVEPTAALATTPAAQIDRPLKILAVDDDPLILMNMAAFLEDMGHQVWEASSGAEALGICRAHPGLDLLVTDQAMPNMTGVQLAMQLKAEQRDLPIILATGYGEVPTDSGIEVIKLSKPYSQQDLEGAITRALCEA